jgi:hypothetical protein
MGKIAPLHHNSQRVFSLWDANGINSNHVLATLISHSHYDHMEDLPHLIRQQTGPMKIIASPSASCIAGNFITKWLFINAEEKKASTDSDGEWIQVGSQFRVLPIKSSHAPHLKGVHMMKGDASCEKFADYKDPDAKTRAMDWKEGPTYSFLVDVIERTDTLRIFIQTSASGPPDGLPPLSQLRKKKVDLAFICAASGNNVKNYPEKLLQLIDPTHTVLVHWEDFFRDMYDGKMKRVRMTNLHKILKRLQKQEHYEHLSQLKSNYSLPRPLGVMNFKY